MLYSFAHFAISHLMTHITLGTTPPSPFKRIIVHMIFPLSIFLLAGLVATRVADDFSRMLTCWALVGLLIFYALTQAIKWRMKTISVRKDLLWLKYQIIQRQS
jgi:hypothetical protein